MSDHAIKLQKLLENQVASSEGFLCVLLQEREIIAKNNINQLPELTEQKLKLIETLTQSEIDILSLLKEQLGDQATEQPDKSIQHLDIDNQYGLVALLQQARNLAAQCKRENQINSQIIESCQNQTEQTLDILLGREKHSVYNPAGKAIKQGGGSLGEA